MKKNQLKYCQSIDPSWQKPEKLWINKGILKKACPNLIFTGDLLLVQLYIADQVSCHSLPPQIASKEFIYTLEKFMDPIKRKEFLSALEARFK